MKFQKDLPEAPTVRSEPIDWATAKAKMIEHEGEWGKIAENVSASFPTQLRKGVNKNFRGDELENFEFASRKPEDPDVSYRTGFADLWGRYETPEHRAWREALEDAGA